MQKLKDSEYDTWNGVIKSAIDLSNIGGRKTILETCGGIPCGFINFSKFTNNQK